MQACVLKKKKNHELSSDLCFYCFHVSTHSLWVYHILKEPMLQCFHGNSCAQNCLLLHSSLSDGQSIKSCKCYIASIIPILELLIVGRKKRLQNDGKDGVNTIKATCKLTSQRRFTITFGKSKRTLMRYFYQMFTQ